MERGKIVSRVRTNNRILGTVVETELRNCGWRYLNVQWITNTLDLLPNDEKLEWLRHDELVFIDPFEQLNTIQCAMTLSSALLSKNYQKVLEKEYAAKKE